MTLTPNLKAASPRATLEGNLKRALASHEILMFVSKWTENNAVESQDSIVLIVAVNHRARLWGNLIVNGRKKSIAGFVTLQHCLTSVWQQT